MKENEFKFDCRISVTLALPLTPLGSMSNELASLIMFLLPCKYMNYT